MSGRQKARAPLTGEQRRLVRSNVGLVAVHLRRHVLDLSTPRRDREWEDLFQEGCLGLIQAAVTYRPEQGIPFSAFALPRIHNAVSRALQDKFSTVRVPPRRSRGARDPGRSDEAKRPTVCSLSADSQHAPEDKRRHQPHRSDGETIGDRLRGKYERAVSAAGKMMSHGTSTRGDRDKLVRTLVEERFLVPLEESRRALRQIARDTSSSYARVAQCDRQLGDAIRATLKADPEFGELRRRVKADPDGVDAPIDAGLEDDLAKLSAETYLRRFRAASPEERARVLSALLAVSDAGFDEFVRSRVSRLPVGKRELLLKQPA